MTWFGTLAAFVTPARVAAFNNWRRQPTTVAGLGAISGAITAYAAGGLTGPQFAAGLMGGLIACVLPDNSDRKTSTVPAAVVAVQPSQKVSS